MLAIKAPNQTKIDQELIMTDSITLEKIWMVSDRIVDFIFASKFTGPYLQ